jgi:hypothetical protein
MSINHDELKKALRILTETPGKIAAAEETYKTTMAEIKRREATGDWSLNAIRAEKERATKDRDRVCHALAHAMRPALETVKANNNLADEPLNITDARLQNAVSVMSLMGKNLSYADQVSLLETFRGDPANLRFIKSAFEKNGLTYAARQADSMMKSISAQALNEMETVLDFHDYAESQGRYEFPIEKAFWTKGEYQRQYERMGYSDATDPYAYALDLEMENVREREMFPQFDRNSDPEAAARERAEISAMKYKIAKAQRDVANAHSTGQDATAIFNDAIRSLESRADA